MSITLNTSGSNKENSPFIATDDNSSLTVSNTNCSTTTAGAVYGTGFIGWANGFSSLANQLSLSNVSIGGNFTTSSSDATWGGLGAMFGHLWDY